MKLRLGSWLRLVSLVGIGLLPAHAGAETSPLRLDLRVATLDLRSEPTGGADQKAGPGRSGELNWLQALLRQLIPIEPAAAGRVIPNARLPSGADLRVPLDLSVAIGRLNAKPIRVDDFRAELLVSSTDLVLAPVSARTLGGTLELRFRSRGGRPALRVELSNSLSQLDIAELLRLARSSAAVRGRLSTRVKLAGSGDDLYRWLTSARGELQVLVEHGAMPGELLELWGGHLLGNLLFRSGKRATPVHCLIAVANVADGIMTFENLVLDTPEVLVLGAGTLNLKSEALDMELRPRPKGVTLFTAATPLRIAGTLAKPKIEVVKLALLRKALTLSLAGFTPEGLLGLFEGDNQACRKALTAAK